MTLLKNPIKRLFYVPKHSKATDKSSLVQIFLCLISMIFSISYFASLTWAWFSDTATSGVLSITSAKYNVAVTVINSSDNGIIKANEKGTYILKSGDYKITMTAEGTATESSGYCKMTMGENKYYSPRLKTAKSIDSELVNSITFSLKLNEDAELIFSSSWEAYPKGELRIIKDHEVITYGKAPVIIEDKTQGEDKAETDNNPEDITEDKKEDGDNTKTENPPAVIEKDDKKEDIKDTEVKSSLDNNEKSNDASVQSQLSVTDGTKDNTLVETELP